MNRKTHNRIAKIILPDVDTRIIDRINKRMDRPETWAPVVSPALGKVPGLSYRGHRRQGHDVMTAARIGLQEGGLEGLIASATHLALDAGRDQITKKYGAGVPDLVEALVNLGFDVYKKSPEKRRKRRRIRQVFPKEDQIKTKF